VAEGQNFRQSRYAVEAPRLGPPEDLTAEQARDWREIGGRCAYAQNGTCAVHDIKEGLAENSQEAALAARTVCLIGKRAPDPRLIGSLRSRYVDLPPPVEPPQRAPR
jgi:hypothetical protein